jgi:hypothetical protein
MLSGISGMQSSKGLPPKIREESAKRTTVILDKEEREFIDQLIREGKEQGIKPLISKMLEVYRSMMVYDWHFPGEYYCGISRIAFVNIELLNILIQHTPKEKWREMGRQMGAALKVSMETTLDLPQSRVKIGTASLNSLKCRDLVNSTRKTDTCWPSFPS